MLTRRGGWIALLILLLVPLLFYGSMVFQGLEPAAPDTGAARPFGIWGDEVVHLTGRIPAWYPYIFSGMPSYGSLIYTPRSPVNPIAIVQRFVRGDRGAYYVFLLVIAGWAGYALLRRQGRSRVASTAASLTYTMTPYFAGAVAAGHSTKFEALCLVPLLVLLIDVFLERPNLLRTAMLAGGGALLAWTNHPQIAFYGLMIGALYALGVLVLERRAPRGGSGWIRLGGFLVLALLLSLSIVADPYLAIHEYAPYSIRGGASAALQGGGHPMTGVGWDYATAWSFHPKELISFLFPGWFGLQGDTYWGPMLFTQSTHYFGIAALALALFGLFRLKGRRRWIWGGISLIVLVIGFGRYVPVLYGPMYRLVPYFNRFRVPSMIYSTLPFCLAYLVAGGMDALVDELRAWSTHGVAGVRRAGTRPARSEAKGGRSARKGAAGAGSETPAPVRRLLFLLVGIVVAWLLIGLGARAALSGPNALLRGSEIGTMAPAAAGVLQSQRLGILERSVAQGFSVLLAGTALLLLAATGFWPRRAIMPWSAVAISVLLVGDIFAVGQRFYHVEPPRPVQESIPMPGACDFLTRQPGTFRVFPASSAVFSSNAFGLDHLESIGGYHAAKLRIYQDLLDENLVTSPSVLRMLNVRYLLSPAPINLGVQPAFQGDGYVYALPESLPRAWAVQRLETAPDRAGMLRRIGEDGFDPGSEAVVLSGAPRPAGDSFAPASISALERTSGTLRFRVHAEGAAFVVASEIFYPPGWRLTIDGAPARIYPVDHVLMGCEVPAGDHEVLWVTHSPGLDRGRAVSHAAAGLLVILAALGGVSSRRRRAQATVEK